MRFLIIGLGIYGSNLAIDLTNLGHEVIGADSNAAIVESLKDSISTTYILDSTDEAALRILPLTNVDLVIVAIGENFGASVRTVALLLKAGVKHIYARAVDDLHEAILQGFHIDRIITPEQRAARDLVLEMALGTDVEALKVSDDSFVVRFKAPKFFLGLTYAEIDFPKTYRLDLVAVTRSVERRNILGMASRHPEPLPIDPQTVVEPDDVIVCFGKEEAWRKLCRNVANQ